ncbi:MAG: AEC family transporter [Porticoccaceae bacterium]
MVQVLLNVVFPVFCCVLIGYVWGKSRFDYATEFVTRLVSNVGAPCLIVATINESQLNWQDFLVMAKLSFAVMAGFALLGMVAFKLLKMDFRALSLAVIFPNTGNMGLSLCLFAFGEEGLALALIIFVIIALVHFACGDFILSKNASVGDGLLNLFKQPIIFATLFSMLQVGLDFELPTALATTTKLLGGMTIPLMLVTLGLSLATIRFADVRKGLVVAILRVPGGLLVALVVVALVGVEGLMAKVLILQSVMPSAVFNYFFALKYKQEVEVVASSVVISTLLAFLMLPPLLWYLLGRG